jgi:hypothetical protein
VKGSRFSSRVECQWQRHSQRSSDLADRPGARAGKRTGSQGALARIRTLSSDVTRTARRDARSGSAGVVVVQKQISMVDRDIAFGGHSEISSGRLVDHDGVGGLSHAGVSNAVVVRRRWSEDLEEPSGTHPTADAHRDHHPAGLPPAAFDQRMAGQARAAHAVGVSERNRAAVNVEPVCR